MDSINFSIVIPTYNRPKLLHRSLLSVVNQSYKNFEVLVVNDGSTKGIEEYAVIKNTHQNHSNIRFIDQENSGVAAARNNGIIEAKGEFICFLDDDDYYLDNHLKVLNSLIDQNNSHPGIYRTLTKIESEPGEFVNQKKVKWDRTTPPVRHILDFLLTTNNICVHRDIILNYRFNADLKVAEDYELWLRLLLHHDYFETMEYTTVYDKTRESRSTGNVDNLLKHIEVFDYIFKEEELVRTLGKDYCKRIYKKYYSWIIDEYQKKSNLKGFNELKIDLIKRVGLSYYLRKRLAFAIKY